jgi:disulfide bond formation protein DsbB
MTIEDVIYGQAWASVLALAAAVIIALFALSARMGLISVQPSLRQLARVGFLPAAAAVAVIATWGSLYLSEVANFLPCEYCWYQRIAMYPLALILVIAAVTRDLRIWRYALPLAVIGAGVSIYHYWLQENPDGPAACSAGVPCSVRYVDELGFVSIPWMAMSAFILIAVLLVVARAVGAAPNGGDGETVRLEGDEAEVDGKVPDAPWKSASSPRQS